MSPPSPASPHWLNIQQIAYIHQRSGHSEIKQTLYFTKQKDPTVSKANVQLAVKMCTACQSTNSALVHWWKRRLNEEDNWSRVGVDITDYGGDHYLSLIDCGPLQFAICWSLHQQDSPSVICHSESIFYECGPLIEILADNGTAFTSQHFPARLACTAPSPAGNGIVERIHRSVKTIATRKQCSIPEVV